MKNINISLPKNIEDWLRKDAKIEDDYDLEFAIVYSLSKLMVMEEMKKNEESEQ